MLARITLLPLVTALLLLSARSRADYDWYEEREGSYGESEDDDDGYEDIAGLPRAAREGFGLGLRLSYAHPLGDVARRAELAEEVRGAIKGQLDLEYGIDPNWVVGAYLAVGGGFLPKVVKKACDREKADCRILVLESGLAAIYRILPDSLIDPWLGANLGLTWLRNSIEADGGDASISLLGLGFGFTLGADVQLGRVAFGPFFSTQIGRFMRAKVKLDAPTFDGDDSVDGKIDRRAFHYWLNFGLRARVQF